MSDNIEHLRRQIADLHSKNARQRQDIARLTRQVEQLQADKAGLRLDLRKAEALNRICKRGED